MSFFELYAICEAPKEIKIAINSDVRKILNARYPNGCFTTDEREEILRECCVAKGLHIDIHF